MNFVLRPPGLTDATDEEPAEAEGQTEAEMPRAAADNEILEDGDNVVSIDSFRKG